MWRHIAQSVQGARHGALGTPNQDSCLVRLLGSEPGAPLVACVADGAGSSEHSGVGSRLACQSIADSAAAHFQHHRSFAGLKTDDVLAWCEAARKQIVACAQQNERDIRDYATTLCTAILSPKASLFFQIGDGAIVARRNTSLGVVFWPQSGEYANATNFLTSSEFRVHVEVCFTPETFSDVALMTDGMERLALKFDSLTPHPPFFEPLFRALREAADVDALAEDLRQLLQSDSVQRKTDDDKTLVLASRL